MLLRLRVRRGFTSARSARIERTGAWTDKESIAKNRFAKTLGRKPWHSKPEPK